MFQYPYGDSQQLNLDWLMEQWLETKASIDGSLQGEIDRVEAAITDLLTARDQAVAARTAAEAAATSAAGYAGTASTAASTATAQAAAAAASAALAGNHASNAQTSETNAGLQATAAGNSASAAATSATNARNSELAAAASSSAAAGNALYAEGMAKGTQNGTPVTSGSPYYEDNAKYYADQAAQDASDAADSAQDAQDAAALIDMPATSADIGKAIIVKTVTDGKVSEYEFGEAGGGGGGTPGVINTIENVPIASFDDSISTSVQQLIVDIDPVQSGSGTPAPNNERPLTGWTGAKVYRTGKNLFNPSDLRVSKAIYGNEQVGQHASLFDSTASDTFVNIAYLKAGVTYSLSYQMTSAPASTSQRVGYICDNNGIVLQGSVATWQNNVSSVQITPTKDGWLWASVDKNATDFQIEPNASTAYEPYTAPTIYSIIFPAAAGTVYGATLTNLGADEWKLTITHIFGSYNLADATFTNLTNTKHTGISNFFAYPVKGSEYGSNNPKYISNILPYGYNTSDMTHWYCVTGWKSVYVYVPIDMDVTNATFQCIAELVTPIEYTFTGDVIELLLNYNNVWADTGNIKMLQYYADSKKYIDDQDALIRALIAKELPDMTADTALVANDFRIVDNTLYKITSSVASGGTLTPGTNCTATTITDVLKSLL